MVRVIAFFIIFFGLSFYFLQVEHGHVRNNLVCTFASQSTEKIYETYTRKFKNILPSRFPRRRLEYLSQKILTPTDSNQVLTCNLKEKMDYEASALYFLRSQAYPIFPDALDTLDWIAVSHRKESIMLNQLAKFKQIIFQEKSSFENFVQDCSTIQEMTDQVKLLEKHLKIEKQAREPSQVKKLISRVSKNIARQLEFAKRHLQSNEKMFQSKWNRFFEFESEKNLCPR